MKLSEAIRLSIGVVTEVRNCYLVPRWTDDGNKYWCGCALGTAGYSIGLRDLCHPDDARLFEAFPLLGTMVEKGPYYGTLAQVISCLHYKGHMTREEIAQWVESLEVAVEVPLKEGVYA